MARTIVWFRGKELRLGDHAPLRDAIDDGEVIPLFVVDPYFFAPERAQRLPHRIQFLLESLAALEHNLAHKGSRLVYARGKSVSVVPELARKWKVDRVVAHRACEPFARERDRRIAQALEVPFDLYEGETLVPPETLRTGAGTPYSVFTPFHRAFGAGARLDGPLPPPRRIAPPPGEVKSSGGPPTLGDLGLARNPRLVDGGEKAARSRLRTFLRDRLPGYAEGRDRLDANATSRLSADLKFGTLSVRTAWTAAEDAGGAEAFLRQLVWREFAYQTLWDRPHVLERPFREDFEGFPWEDDEAGWEAWALGRTGYPLVDAAARQLLAEGYVENRARMIAASFLTKHLLIDYRRGEAHYLKWLVDGDWANNNLGWQWSAGCGCDAQPYFRVFNPMTQGKRYDPKGEYVRRFVPELERVPDRWIHAPWTAPTAVLAEAGVTLGETYPAPIVDHKTARERFLETAKSHLSGG